MDVFVDCNDVVFILVINLFDVVDELVDFEGLFGYVDEVWIVVGEFFV